MFNKKPFSSVCTFLCFCAMVCALWGCIGFTTDWGLGDAELTEGQHVQKWYCVYGTYVVENVAEDSLSGNIILTYDGSENSETYSYEFRGDTLVFVDVDGNEAYTFVGGKRGLLIGKWNEEYPLASYYWEIRERYFYIYAKEGKICVE